jgi:hypothetical protein
MRGVMRTVLKDVAAHGNVLPGDHHFFITFDTQAPGVKLSSRMRAQYPQDMTIVLQHQFWDLAVTDDVLEVGLSFGGVPERLAIPMAAIKSFVDPSVKFGMQFADAAETPAELPAATAQPEKTPTPTPTTEVAADPAAPKSEPKPSPEKPSAEVVRFDRFRKK